MMRTLLVFFFVSIGMTGFSYDWDQLADFGGTARHRTPMLAIGNKIYTGLGHYNGGAGNTLWEDWWEYDPATNAWTQKANYGGGINYHATGFTIGDYGYVGTGRVTSSGNNLTKSFYRYDPVTNTWTQMADFGGAARRGAVGFAIDGYGYIGTGEPPSGALYNDFYKYDPSTDSWSPIASLPTAGRVSAVGFELGGYGYCGTGGFGSFGGSQKDFWRYDPNTDTWQQMADVGTIPRMEATGFSHMGKGYILCGDNMSSGINYSDMYEYDPAANVWTQREDFPGTARRYMAAATLNDITYCGLGTNGTNFKDFWRFSANAFYDEAEDISTFDCYPNPVTNQVNFRADLNENYSITIMNSQGKIVHKIDEVNGSITIERNGLPSGVYIYTIKTTSGIQTGKLIFK